MQVALTPLSSADTPWLLHVAEPYFNELVPGFGQLAQDRFDIWWTDADRAAYAILVNDKRCGFALIRRCEDGHHEISEFCIVPSARNAGTGTHAATLCLRQHLGPWRIGVASALPGTARFWDRLLKTTPGITDLAQGPALTPSQAHSYTFTYRNTP
ncbi:GNAT family N-acetyltransferase [Tateyamaria sp. ANG-S1]|uniref:GNAT family N-acetyltransferase n=1 Tax=Tateyamaria sp. ANG-S1 TaxID=1577905 RepID=UPI00068AD505|nr:GNAT family N-acetyltransferase [Tateyamaria sp. ANG-S1]